MPQSLPSALSLVPRSRAFVGLGGNLGEVQAQLQAALSALNALPGTRVEAVSSLYRTRPVEADGPDYLNAVATLQSALGPRELLRALHALEHAHDRQRPYQNAPRTLDLDLLAYGAYRCNTPALALPHPRAMARAFVVEPLSELIASLGDAALPAELTLPDAAARHALAQEQGIERLDAPNWSI